ncbi:MAG: lysophospholipase, partial [Desulfovibrionales bacterium]|nr:lysophospholipase [Desulfovibrionales bacterium]
MHTIGYFTGKNGIDIFTQTWIPPMAPKARLAIVHGLGEHSGRYQNLIAALAPLPISIHALDHRGHGKSAGKRGHINAFSDYTEDLDRFLDEITTPPLPTFVLGHSLGGLIALSHALDHP